MRTPHALAGLLTAVSLLVACQSPTTGVPPELLPSAPTSCQGQGADARAGLDDGSSLAQHPRLPGRDPDVPPAALEAPRLASWLPNLGSLIPGTLVSDSDIFGWLPPPPPPENDESSDGDEPGDWTRRHRRAWRLYRYLARWAAENYLRAILILLKLVVLIYPAFFANGILAGLGFGLRGVAAGSLAAWIQSVVGNVARHGLFAYMQSAGTGGYGASYVEFLVQLLSGSSLVLGIMKHFYMDPVGLEALLTVFLYRWLGCALFSKLVCETYCVDCTSSAVSWKTVCSERL